MVEEIIIGAALYTAKLFERQPTVNKGLSDEMDRMARQNPNDVVYRSTDGSNKIYRQGDPIPKDFPKI